MENRAQARFTGPKCIAIIGPLESGKSTLFNAILARTGSATFTNGTPTSTTITTEASFATTSYMGESITFVDCPGSVEFSLEAEPVLMAADAAIIVADADDKKLPQLQMVLRRLDQLALPHILFLNKIDKSTAGIRDTLKILQSVSSTPLLLRQIPLRQDDSIIGSVDLALERAYIYQENAPSEIRPIPDDAMARKIEARFTMLETLADYNDELMEQLLEEKEPPRDAVFDDLAADLRNGSITPVLIGSAERGNGVSRLLKTIRHDVPDVTVTRKRLNVTGDDTKLLVMKTLHTGHGGKISIARILSGSVSDGMELGSAGRISGLYQMKGREQVRISGGKEGDTVAAGKLENAQTGDLISSSKGKSQSTAKITRPQHVYSIAIRPKDRKDEVKLSAALQKLIEEDPSLSIEQRKDTAETVLHGHGEIHLRLAKDKLEERYQIAVNLTSPSIPYRETIAKAVTQKGRHKKQSGGHGQFGDVVLQIRPLTRGGGFEFTETTTGGVVPKQYIPSVETGVRESLQRGPLGFPVTDIAVNLSDGSYHSVDSSDLAFQLAAKIAMRDGLAQGEPVLLEPIMKIEVDTPSEATARVTAILSQRRGQIMGFETYTDRTGWDLVEALIPEAEISNLIIELRSVTTGAATYRTQLYHLSELTGRLAENVLANHKTS